MTTLAPAGNRHLQPIRGADDAPPTYHDRPALKPSLYGWLVGLYIFIGGLAAAAQILATAADLIGLRGGAGVILGGRVLALAGAIAGGVLLIIDLHTPKRFFNMLRIFRPTSPMSIGTYVLMTFGFWSLAALISQLFGPHWLTLVCAGISSIAGWFMTSYTASLLAATSTPLWAAAPRSLAVRFAGSAMATGGAALCIIALTLGSPLAHPLVAIAVAALGVELVASIVAQFTYGARGVIGPLRDLPWGPLHLIGVQLCGDALPIGLYVWAMIVSSPLAALIASLCALGGGFLMRGLMFMAGNESARRPRDYFRFARPRAGGAD